MFSWTHSFPMVNIPPVPQQGSNIDLIFPSPDKSSWSPPNTKLTNNLTTSLGVKWSPLSSFVVSEVRPAVGVSKTPCFVTTSKHRMLFACSCRIDWLSAYRFLYISLSVSLALARATARRRVFFLFLENVILYNR